MERSSTFSLSDLVASFVLGLLVIGFTQVIVGCGDFEEIDTQRGKAMQMQSSTQIRGIIQGCVNFSPGNNEWYPGIDGRGRIDTRPQPSRGPGSYSTASVSGAEPVYRYTMMLTNNYFSPEYTISPFDEDAKAKQRATSNTPVTTANFSFAMLRIDQPDTGRGKEWRQTTNSRAVVMSDRNTAGAAGAAARSVQSQKSWVGTVGYNDNHVTIEKSSIQKTEYSMQGETVADDLFADDKNKDGKANVDAAMVYQDATTYVNQK